MVCILDYTCSFGFVPIFPQTAILKEWLQHICRKQKINKKKRSNDYFDQCTGKLILRFMIKKKKEEEEKITTPVKTESLFWVLKLNENSAMAFIFIG